MPYKYNPISGEFDYYEAATANAVSSSSTITDNAVVRGDGGSRGVQDSGVIIDDSDNVSGVTTLQTDDGSATDPSHTFSSDTASGMYLESTNNVAWSTNGTKKLALGASGVLSSFGGVSVESGRLSFDEALLIGVRSVAGNISGSTTDYVMAVTDTSSPRTVEIPNVSNTNQAYIIKDASGGAGTNNITITTPGGSKTIDGSTSYVIDKDYGSVAVYYDGSNYNTIAVNNISLPITETDGGTGQSTFATGDILYASASDTLSKLTAGSNDQVLTLAGGVPSWADAAGSAPTMRADNYSYDFWDFDTSQSIPHGFWNRYSNGGSGGTVGMSDKAVGIYNLNTSSSSTGRSNLTPSGYSIILGTAKLTLEWRVYIPNNLSNGTERFETFCGLYDDSYTSAIGSVDDLCGFRYSDTINSGKWEAFTRKNSTETTLDTGTTVAADTWYRLRLVVNAAASSVEFFVDGSSAGTISTNIPSGSSDSLVYSAYIEKSVGTTTRSFYVDYCEKLWEFSGGR